MSNVTKVIVSDADGNKTAYDIRDQETAEKVTRLLTHISSIQASLDRSAATEEALKESVAKTQKAVETVDSSLNDLDSRVTSVETKETSLEKKHSALDLTVQNVQESLTEEIARAKTVEGERENLTASSKDTLVDAINWVQTRAEKAIEDVSAIGDATTSESGLMSAEDKAKLDGIAEGANKITVDSALSETSENPVQNKEVRRVVMKSFLAYNPISYQDGSWGVTLAHTGRAISNVVGRTATGGWVVRSDLMLSIYDVSAASAANYELASVTGLCDSVKKVLGGSSWTIAEQIVPCPLCEVLSRSTDYHGYGNSVRVLTDGIIHIGRTYTTDGAYGSLAMDCYNTGAYSFSFYFVVNP